MQSDVLTLVAARPGRVRDGLRALLATIPWLKVIGQADDGASALEIVAEHQPALVLLDTNLPGGEPFDGGRPVRGRPVHGRPVRTHSGAWAVLKQIKARWPQVRCLVLTGNGRQGQTARAAGADGVLIRGFSTAELLTAIERLLSRGVRRERPRREPRIGEDECPSPAPVASQDVTEGKTVAKKARLLIVDDEAVVALSLQNDLEKLLDCEIATALSGEQALRLCEGASFDVLITDYDMPDVDGVALAEHVRQLYPRTAIIMIAGQESDVLHERAAHASVQYVLDKPVQPEEICNLVFKVLGGPENGT